MIRFDRRFFNKRLPSIAYQKKQH